MPDDDEICGYAVMVKVIEPYTFGLVYRLETVTCIRADEHHGLHIIPTPEGTP